jgi:Cu+-exporting ATPase
MFFSKAWRSLVNRSLNMFTLIATGVGAAYFYSAVAVIAPGIFPESFRESGEVGLYFEAAAVITVLVLLGQLLEAKARSQTSQAIRALLARRRPHTASATIRKGGSSIKSRRAICSAFGREKKSRSTA